MQEKLIYNVLNFNIRCVCIAMYWRMSHNVNSDLFYSLSLTWIWVCIHRRIYDMYVSIFSLCFVQCSLNILYKVCCQFIVTTTTPQSPQLNEKSSSYHSTRQNGFYWHMHMRHSMERNFFFSITWTKSFNCFNSLVYYRFGEHNGHVTSIYNYDKWKIVLNDEKNEHKNKKFIYNTLLLKCSFICN